jgi:hypothetical protein
MHIVAIVGAIIAGIGIWYWRFRMLKEAGQDAADVVGRVRGAYRMRRFKKQVEGSTLNAIDDPAMAAAVFLYALAGDHPLTAERSRDAIKAHIAAIVPANELDEVLAYAAWAARDIVDPRDCIRRFKPLWRDALTAAERAELMEMAQAVLAASPEVEPHQQLTLETLRTALS